MTMAVVCKLGLAIMPPPVRAVKKMTDASNAGLTKIASRDSIVSYPNLTRERQ